ncbi:Protein LAZ1 [Hibiscus syriacus]|uniref:Protein LAZ1 n=1 Tax=Hibiscus syriacus TaxID=106335 RepID=A0A6A3AGH0_HIBSY|nr:Protein LAZ1 [Hibiscus syriacus]
MKITDYLLGYSPPIWATLIAGVFVVVTLSLSMYLVLEHLYSYKNPEEQKFLIGVVLMVPCYSVESFVSLVDPSISVDCSILRDCYESFAMYCFERYLVACLGSASSKTPLLDLNYEQGTVKHPFPMNYILRPWKLGQGFYQVVKFGIVQYMLIKSLTALLAVILEAFDVYCEGEFKWGCGYPYMAVVLNFSQSWALYCLLQFYTVTKDELAHINPLAKFLTFKTIVFLTWWQGVAIALFYSLGLFRSPIAEGLQLKSSVQNFIICIEVVVSISSCLACCDIPPVQMGIASIVHLYVFPSKPYELMEDPIPRNVAILGDYESVNCPLVPNEVTEGVQPTTQGLPQPDMNARSGMTIKESVKDVFIGGGEYIVNDVKFTVNQAVVPVEKGITKFNNKLHKISERIKRHRKHKRKTKDDSCIPTAARRVVCGTDDPLLDGSLSDSGVAWGRKRRRKSGYSSVESLGESSRGDERNGEGYLIRDHKKVKAEMKS